MRVRGVRRGREVTRVRSVTVLGTAAAALVAAALLAGCGDDAGEGEPTPTPSTSAPATPSPDVPEPVPPSPSSPFAPPSTSQPGEVTITGELVDGVEPGCLLLQTGSGDYLLFGDPVADLRSGPTVTVTGRVRTDMASTCQQGTPFEVTEVLR